MSDDTNYADGSEIIIGADTIILSQRKNAQGTEYRWTWYCPDAGVGSEGTKATPHAAMEDARLVLGGPQCRHGAPTGHFCPTCHDTEI